MKHRFQYKKKDKEVIFGKTFEKSRLLKKYDINRKTKSQ